MSLSVVNNMFFDYSYFYSIFVIAPFHQFNGGRNIFFCHYFKDIGDIISERQNLSQKIVNFEFLATSRKKDTIQKKITLNFHRNYLYGFWRFLLMLQNCRRFKITIIGRITFGKLTKKIVTEKYYFPAFKNLHHFCMI